MQCKKNCDTYPLLILNNPCKISVGIPVYNGEKYIREAIDSVLKQTCKDFELIIVDNNSSDGTREIVQSYTDPRIKLFRNETNIGMIPNFNRVMELATGTYIKVLPADDLLYPECLDLQSKILDNDKDKKISLVSGRRKIVNDDSKVLFERGYTKSAIEVDGKAAVARVIRAGGNILGEGGAVMFRRELLAKTGYFRADIFYVLDLDLWFRILLHGNLYAIPQVVSAFRISAVSESVKVANKQRKDYLDFIDKIYADKNYQLGAFSYYYGTVKTAVLTEMKKILYKFIVR